MDAMELVCREAACGAGARQCRRRLLGEKWRRRRVDGQSNRRAIVGAGCVADQHRITSGSGGGDVGDYQ